MSSGITVQPSCASKGASDWELWCFLLPCLHSETTTYSSMHNVKAGGDAFDNLTLSRACFIRPSSWFRFGQQPCDWGWQLGQVELLLRPPQKRTPATFLSSRSADSTSSMPAKGSRLRPKPTHCVAGRRGRVCWADRRAMCRT